jgi:predicted nucleic acid-binding protein
MSFTIDMAALHERAAKRAANPANAANRLISGVSQLATLATSRASARPAERSREASGWTDDDIASFLARHNRLLRWGWAESESEQLAERLVERDREHEDDRVSCADCTHYRSGRCGNYGRAGLQSPDVGRAWVTLLQRCPGFEALR